MRFPNARFKVLLWLSVAMIVSPGIPVRAQEEVSAKAIPEISERVTGPHRPLSAQVARTWIALHESKIRPLPDRAPLRQILQALRDATRGKAGWTEGIRFRVVSEALGESEITIDAPVTLPFIGCPEVSVDMYLKYLLREFGWERYVCAGAIVIDSPSDDCVGYETVSPAEAHAWLLLHESVSLELPQKAQLGVLLSAITKATRGKGEGGRGLIIYPRPGALRTKALSLSTPVPVDAGQAEIGDRLRTTLQPLGLGPRVLTDGTVMLAELDHGESEGKPEDDAFPEYRFSYSFVWNQWVEALKEAAQAKHDLEKGKKATRP